MPAAVSGALINCSCSNHAIREHPGSRLKWRGGRLLSGVFLGRSRNEEGAMLTRTRHKGRRMAHGKREWNAARPSA
eukprot:scaffold12470_cov119-Isochrysis_galbana.AAC.17